MVYCAGGEGGVTLMLCKNASALLMNSISRLICNLASWICWSSAMRWSMRVVIVVVVVFVFNSEYGAFFKCKRMLDNLYVIYLVYFSIN